MKRRLLILLLPLLLASCSTKKAKWVNVRYHNLTCHYNVWWNGNESLKAGRLKLYAAATDDYSTFLPPEPLGTEENAQSVQPEMDRAIEKGIKGVQKHSINVKGKEHVAYIKDCYLLTAYASFYKQDFASTRNSCNILLTNFPSTSEAAEAAVLTARCMVRDRSYTEAETLLSDLAAKLDAGDFPKSQADKLYLAMVEALLPQEKYKKTVEYIHLVLDATSSSLLKARLTYLLAQIYQHLDRRSVAARYYAKVPSYHPPYVLEFNARLGEASCADFQHSDIKKLERRLDAMARDAKNAEYLDRIYYAKGEMFLGVKDAKRACDNFRRSAALAAPGSQQKARSAFRAAEILYDLYENYDLAYLYYDTVAQIATRDFLGYHEVRRRHALLAELTSYTRVFHRADSLLAVATLPEEQRLALINAQIDTLRRHEQQAREQALLSDLAADAKAQSNTLTGDWYFYNASTVQKGKEAFRQRWGMRLLEDLWCLSDRTVSSFALPDDMASTSPDPSSADPDAPSADPAAPSPTAKFDPTGDPSDPHSIAYYLKDLPTTPRQLDSLDSLIPPSLLGAAYIYFDGIGNLPLALQCYHRLAEHYTAYPPAVQAFYMLYRIYDRQGNTPQADYYRDMVLLGFPDSDFANLIRDEQYARQLLLRQQRIADLYATLYDYYQQHRYASVLDLAAEVESTYPDHPSLAKFRFWKALALARTSRTDQAIALLDSLASTTAPTDSIHPLAQAQLRTLRLGTLASTTTLEENTTLPDLPTPATDAPAASPTTADPEPPAEQPLPPEALHYRYRARQQHFVAILIDDRTINATELQYRLADFNTQFYPNSGYKANAVLFTDTSQLITIHSFADEAEAMRYYRHLLAPESPLQAYPEPSRTPFPISSQNYSTFYNRKNLAAYLAFFQKYYKQQ